MFIYTLVLFTAAKTFAADLSDASLKFCNSSKSICFQVESEKTSINKQNDVFVFKNATVTEFRNQTVHSTKNYQMATMNYFSNELVMTDIKTGQETVLNVKTFKQKKYKLNL